MSKAELQGACGTGEGDVGTYTGFYVFRRHKQNHYDIPLDSQVVQRIRWCSVVRPKGMTVDIPGLLRHWFPWEQTGNRHLPVSYTLPQWWALSTVFLLSCGRVYRIYVISRGLCNVSHQTLGFLFVCWLAGFCFSLIWFWCWGSSMC